MALLGAPSAAAQGSSPSASGISPPPATFRAKPSAKPPIKLRHAPKGLATRAKGPRLPPNDSVRRAVAGVPTDPDALREAAALAGFAALERQMFFSSPAPESDASFVPGATSGPRVRDDGMPDSPLLARPPAETRPDLSWLQQLEPPELSFRWDPRILKYLQYYRDDARGRSLLATFWRKSGRYANAIRRALHAENIPEDLMWVALVESGFDPTVKSSAGAMGLWQLMPEGARSYGLVIDRWVDERLDPERSSEAAAKYLADLRQRFGSWELALAAYNMGQGGLLAAIRKYNTNDYWELSRYESGIPWETALYVPKIVALAIVAHNPALFGLQGVKLDLPATIDEVTVAQGASLKALAQFSGTERAVLDGLNPHLRAGRTPLLDDVTASVRLRVPKGKGPLMGVNAELASPPLAARYVAKMGDTVETAAAAAGVERSALMDRNGLQRDEAIREGTQLILPSESADRAAAEDDKRVVVVGQKIVPDAGHRRVYYRVSPVDTLLRVADAFGVHPDDLCRWNSLDPGSRLQEAMMLQILVPSFRVPVTAAFFQEGDVELLERGSPEFFAHFEALRGRTRYAVTTTKEDTWDRLARRFHLTPGQLERINHRSCSEALQAGESVVVYAPTETPAPRNLTVSLPTVPLPPIAGAAACDDDEFEETREE